MSAYNWILIDRTCPVCKHFAEIKCQTHAASDYNGDTRGRFHDREYHIGEEMNWWSKSDHRFNNWKVNGMIKPNETNSEIDQECCYSECLNCKSNLYVVIRFKLNCPIEILDIGKEQEWPINYYK
jgi:hypothetical protein